MTKTPEQALETLQKQYRRQNKYIKENYERITIAVPKGTKEKILAKASETGTGESVSGYIKRIIEQSLV